ncbi:MAG: MFS transporter [Streptosporangiaceae bacterium]|nr:MFS transporter [Streptosporangiaceae bacterium]MBV9855696.1 MFS transporter [Streptosporangiaceae bacterium]
MQLVNKVQHSVPTGLRIALTGFFAADGFIYASWAVRVPAVKQQTGASPGALGLALLGMSAGAVGTMLISGALCRRFGSRRLTVASCALLSVTLILPPLAHSAVVLGGALLVFGAAYGCLNVAMNSVAVDLVARMRRPVMPGFHAAWSFGGLAGAGLGGLLAPYLSPVRHLLLIMGAGLLVAVLCGRTFLARPVPPPDPVTAAGPDRERTEPGAWRGALRTARAVGLFGLIALCAAYGEGAIGDWGALHLRQDLGASAEVAAAAYAAFALAEAGGRLAGITLLERLGRTRVLVLGGLAACAGMLTAALAPDVWLALAGFAATGLGLANLFPAAMSRAGLVGGSDGVAVASTLGYTGFLLGPPLIGFLAGDFGLPAGLTTISLLSLIAAFVAYLSRDVAG